MINTYNIMAETISDSNKFLNLTQLKVYNTKVKSLISTAQNTANNAALTATAANNKANSTSIELANLSDDVDTISNNLDDVSSTVNTQGSTLNTLANTTIPQINQRIAAAKEAASQAQSSANQIMEQVGAPNGIAPLDADGFVDLKYLGNLDITVVEVVSALPTTNIKKHLYMVKSSETTSQNIYKEYIYIGDPSAAYDASKWEQLGEYKANVDLSGYLTKTGASSTYLTKTDASNTYLTKTAAGSYLLKTDANEKYNYNIDSILFEAENSNGDVSITLHDKSAPAGRGYGIHTTVPNATTTQAGFMSKADKAKLDGIASGANKITIDSSLSSSSTNPVQNKVINTALNGKASTDVATTSTNGLMSSTDKTKLDGIAAGANKYVLPMASMSTLGGVKIGSSFYISEDHLELNAITETDINNLF